MDEITTRLRGIERELDAGAYHPGTWQHLLAQVRSLPLDQRLVLASDLDRVSDKLHWRGGRRTIPFWLGVGCALVATAAGAALLRNGLEGDSDGAVIAVAAIWGFTFEPLVKVGVGLLLGVRYSYAYVHGVPRFKMRLGSYLALPRSARVVLHLSGTIGTPLGIYLVWIVAAPRLPFAAGVCVVAFWATLFNMRTFFFWLAGVRKLATVIPLRMSSGGAAAQELLEGLRPS